MQVLGNNVDLGYFLFSKNARKKKIERKKKKKEYKIFLLFVWLSIKNLKKKKEYILFYFYL